MTTEAPYSAIWADEEEFDRIVLEFSPEEADLFNFLLSRPNMQEYIKKLLRTDMEATAKSEASRQLRSYIDLMINTMDKDE